MFRVQSQRPGAVQGTQAFQHLMRSPVLVSRPRQSQASPAPSPSRTVIDINININLNVNRSCDAARIDRFGASTARDSVHPAYEPKPFFQSARPQIQCDSRPSPAREWRLLSNRQPSQLNSLAHIREKVLGKAPNQPLQTNKHDKEQQPATSVTLDSNRNVKETAREVLQTVMVKSLDTQPAEKCVEVVEVVSSSPPPLPLSPASYQLAPSYIPNPRLYSQQMIFCVICQQRFRVSDKDRHTDHHRKPGISLKSGKTTNTGSLEHNDWKVDESARVSYESRKKQVRDMFEEESQPRASYVNFLDVEDDKKVQIRQIDSVAIPGSVNFIGDRLESFRLPSSKVHFNPHPPSFLGPYFGENGRGSASYRESEIMGLPPVSNIKDMPPQICEENESILESQRQSQSQRQSRPLLASSEQFFALPK